MSGVAPPPRNGTRRRRRSALCVPHRADQGRHRRAGWPRREGDGPALQRCPPALPGGGARLGWGEATYTAKPTLAATPAPVWSRVAAHCPAARFTRHGQAVYTIVAQAAAAGVKGLEPTSNALLAARTRTRKQPLLNGVRPTKSCAVSNKHALPQPHSRSCSLHWYCVYFEF